MHDVAKPISLTWQGPFSFFELLRGEKQFDEPGVYIWTEVRKDADRKDADVVSYVGKSQTSLWTRQFEHYLSLIGGQYKIPGQWTFNEKEWGMNYDDPQVQDVLFDLDRLQALVASGFSYASQLRIHVCGFDANKVAVIERNLLYDLRPCDTTWGTRTEPSNRLSIEHLNAKWATKRIRNEQVRDCVQFP